jgi:hypothetical protein
MSKQRGDVPITIDGVTYVLKMDINSMASLEELFDDELTFEEIFKRAQANKLRYVRAIWWAALQHHHPEITIQQAGELLGKAGGMFEIVKRLGLVGLSTIPDPKDVEALPKGTGNPQSAGGAKKKPAGTGARSTAPRDVPASTATSSGA